MILQDEFKKSGYTDILIENTATEYGINLEDIFDLNKKPEELISIFISDKKDELEKKASKYPKIYLNHSNILKYYKDYIDTKKEIKEENKNDTYTLMYLKEQINQLVNQRDNLDKQIEVLQSKVNEILGESKSHGK